MARFLNDRKKAKGGIPGSLIHLGTKKIETPIIRLINFNSEKLIEIKPENFKGLTDVVEIDTKNGFRYATGSFTDYSPAFRYRKKIEVVYPDAFVIAVKDNKMLPLQQALEQKKKK